MNGRNDTVEMEDDGFYTVEFPAPCPTCNGTGYMKSHPLQHAADPAMPFCTRCKGEGRLIKVEG